MHILIILYQAGFPPIPSIFDMAAYNVVSILLGKRSGKDKITAKRPPNAPETVAAEKNKAARKPNSDRLYQLNGNN